MRESRPSGTPFAFSDPHLRSPKDPLLLCVLAAATAWAAWRSSRLELDIENRAMRSASGPDARAEELRRARFGEDATVVLLLEPRDAAAEVDDALLDEWSEALMARLEAGLPVLLPDEHEGERLVAFTLVPDAAGRIAPALAAVEAAARESAPPTHRVWISGPVAGEAAIAAALAAEQRRIVPLVGTVLFLLLLAVYRSFAVALGGLLPALGGIAWTGALQERLGLAVDPVTALLPPVLLSVGVASAVHVVDAFLDARAHGLAPDPASRRAWRAILAPALGCAATTVAGFLALCTSPIAAIGRFGALAAAGVVTTAVLTFVALPPWLRLAAGSARLARRDAWHGRWRALSAVLARALARWSRPLVALALAAAVLLGWAWTRLQVDTDPLRILPASHEFRRATAAIGLRLGGTETFDLLLPPATAGGAGLLALLGLQKELTELDDVVGPAGPPRRADDGTALVPALLAPAGSTARERTFAAAEALARERGFDGARATGPAVRVARDSGAIVRGELGGLLVTFLALAPCVWLGLRSLRLTAAGLAANALPALALHGGLALAGRPLSVASAMISSVMLGLVIDNAIYFLHGYREACRVRRPRLAVARTLQGSGRAISVSSLVLGLGFLAGLAGELSTTREFGALSAATILAAWIANLFLLPAVLLLERGAGRAAGRRL